MRRFLITSAATAVAAIATAAMSTTAGAHPHLHIFKADEARAFCAQDDEDNRDRCFYEQRVAASNIEKFLASGVFSRPDSRRAYAYCETFSGPDLRRTWLCLQDRRDKFRSDRGGSRFR